MQCFHIANIARATERNVKEEEARSCTYLLSYFLTSYNYTYSIIIIPTYKCRYVGT